MLLLTTRYSKDADLIITRKYCKEVKIYLYKTNLNDAKNKIEMKINLVHNKTEC